MKFSNGCWLLKEGYEMHTPKEIYFVNEKGNKLVLLAPTNYIRHRGDTLGGVNLTIEITSPLPEVIRVKAFHYAGVVKKSPEFEVSTQDLPLTYENTEEEIIVSNGSLQLVINKKNWSMQYRRDNEVLTKSGWRDLGYVKTNWKGLAYDNGGDEDTYFNQQLSLTVGEQVYGTGERFTNFIKNGQTIDIWNEDGGTSTEQSYKNIPFYLTNKGYGVFVNHPEKVSFEVASENVKKVGFSVPGESLDYFFINGPSMKEVLERYTALTGRAPLPAPWTYGLWLSTSFTTNYDEKTVLSFIDGMAERDIPLKVFHFDCFWMKDFHWTDFVWDSRVFDNPTALLKKIKDRGIKVCVWINPYIAQESCLFEEGMENGYLLKRPNGNVWQWDMWQPGMAIVDFTNPAACKWYADKLAGLVDMGVDCFKTDFGERIPTDVVYHDGSDPQKMHNYYTQLYNKCVYDLLVEKKGAEEAVLFARSATVGGQKFPVHWGGDCWSDYESMAESLRGGLSLMMSGFAYWSHDIGGFENTSTADVYKRWCAFGLLSSHSRLHGSTSYRVPWAYDDEAVDVVRFFTKFKAKLMPYLYKTSVDATQTGVPTMRAMVLEYTDDITCHYLDKQYMLGDNLLVAPILNDEKMGIFYLPEGTWTEVLTNEVIQGGKWIRKEYDYFSLPLLAKENSVVALGNVDDTPEYEYAKDVTLNVYELAQGSIVASVPNMKGEEKLNVEIALNGTTVTCTPKAENSFKVSFVNKKVEAKENCTVEVFETYSLVTPINVNEKFVVEYK